MNLRLGLALLLASLAAHAEVSLPKVFSSHMVLQREMPIHLYNGAGLPASTFTSYPVP